MVTCIEIRKRFLVQKDTLVQQSPNLYKPVLDFYRSEYKSMNFESEAEATSSEIFLKKGFVVKKRKVMEPQTVENLLRKLPKKSNIKKS